MGHHKTGVLLSIFIHTADNVPLEACSYALIEGFQGQGPYVLTQFHASGHVSAAKRQILAVGSAGMGEIALSTICEVPRAHGPKVGR